MLRAGLLAIVALLPSTLLAAPEPLDLTTEELSPFNMKSGEAVTGLSTDLLRAAFARAGLPMEVHLYPWLRSYQSALDKPNGCVYSTTRIPEREASFKWVGPLVRDDWVVYVLRDSKIRIGSVQDLKRYKTASAQGDALSTYLQGLGLAPEFTPTHGQLQMLESGRIDFWATTQARAVYFSRLDHVELKPVLTLRKAEMYLACNRQVPDQTIDVLNRTLKEMEQDGTVDRLRQVYR